ncbi:EGF-containing fibulin-like extracellular matrix protein 2 [Denticeps clupeoides]|uniref:EGF-containing fibulin-like extracellular matrix protein 2 n=1 Tax=Denticeps clupeoides TaxID=299321 RepID=UPI0010A46EFD|nr:EGF-containing fibulin-like extracellular matrix protein 2 [Denticeps clupeoides]
MLRLCLCLAAAISAALSQQDTEEPVTYTCTDGYEFESERQICRDIDECETLPDACKGNMRCVNHYGGYLCLPHNARIVVDSGEEDQDVPGPAQRDTPASGRCAAGFAPDDHGYCRDVDECATRNPCHHRCANVVGSFVCRCERGFELGSDLVTCEDVDECSFSVNVCQGRCANSPGRYACSCPAGYVLQGTRACKDVNECDLGQVCHEDQMCWNYNGGYQCYPRNPCHGPYVKTGDGRCSCQSSSECQRLPSSIVYRYMSVLSGRAVPSDIFQIQATSVFPNMVNTFRIKAGNEAEGFSLKRVGDTSAMLVMTKSLQGPREQVVDLEMITQNTGLNYRSSSLLRLTIVVGPYPY